MKIHMIDILTAVSAVFGLPLAAITGPSREAKYMPARRAFCFIARHHFGEKFADIGHFLGKRDHTTIITAVNKCCEAMDADVDYQNNVQRAWWASQDRFEARKLSTNGRFVRHNPERSARHQSQGIAA